MTGYERLINEIYTIKSDRQQAASLRAPAKSESVQASCVDATSAWYQVPRLALARRGASTRRGSCPINPTVQPARD